MDLAWSCYDKLLDDDRVFFMREPEGLEEAWKMLTRNQIYSHRIWNDAYLAAFAQTADLKLITFDKGFRDYKKTRVTILS
jgi:predicted nucleic acid-binding protein